MGRTVRPRCSSPLLRRGRVRALPAGRGLGARIHWRQARGITGSGPRPTGMALMRWVVRAMRAVSLILIGCSADSEDAPKHQAAAVTKTPTQARTETAAPP